MGSGDGDGGESNSAPSVRRRLLTSASTHVFGVSCADVFVTVRASSSLLGSRLGSIVTVCNSDIHA